jgi:hypothetical protein
MRPQTSNNIEWIVFFCIKNLQRAELVSADEACDRLSVRIEVLVGGEDD